MRFLKLLGILTAVLAVLAPSVFAELKVALVLDRGGKDDKSFNA
jgi:basic membrane lipoprotein Med (substrate-binding protein (PBP1-ABC) superfamily)